MKKLFILSSLLFSFNFGFAQPQWKFHIAFEDATGAKDTLWLIYDTTAHGSLPTDTALGEGPVSFDYNNFNVWIYNWDGDSTKTLAYPYNAQSFLIEVRAFNYQYPISIRWDSSLFHAPYLPLPVGYINAADIGNDYFYLVNNDPFLQGFNMLLDNQAFAPAFNWGSQNQFPMHFYIAKDPSLDINEIHIESFIAHPNPFFDNIQVSNRSNIKSIEIYSLGGEIIYSKTIKITEPIIIIPTDSFNQGFYILKILTNKNQIYHEKIIKLR